MKGLREGYDNRIAELCHQVDILTDTAIRAREEAEQEAIRMKQLYDQGIVALKLTHEKAVEEALLTAEVKIATTEATAANVEQAVIQGAARTEAVIRSNADMAIANAHDERDKALATAMVIENNLYADLKARHELIINDLTTVHAQEVAELRERHANDMRTLKAQQDSLNVTIAEVRAAYANAISGSVDSLSETLVSKTAVLDEQLLKAERVILELRKQLADSQELVDAAAKREDEVRSYSVFSVNEALTRANEVQATLRTRIDELTAQLAAERLEANRRESELQNQLIQIQAQATSKDVNKQVDELRQIYESAMKEWKNTQEDTVTALKANNVTVDAEHAKVVQDIEKRLIETHTRELNAVKAEADAKLHTDAMKHAAEMADLVSRLTQAQAALGTNGSATSQLQLQEKDHSNSLNAVRTAYESQLTEANQRIARQEERLLSDAEKRYAILKSSYDAREAQIQADHVTMVAELKSRIAQLETLLERTSIDSNRQLQAAKEAAEAAAAEVRAAQEKSLSDVKLSYDRNLAQALSNLVNNVSQLKSSFAVERAELQANAAKQQLQLRQEIETLRKIAEDKLTTEESVTVLRTHYHTEITRIEETHVREITILNEEHIRTVDEVKLVSNQENEKRSNEFATKERQLRAEYATQISVLQNRIRELTSTVAQLSVDHGKQMSDMMAQQAATLVSLRAAAERAANERFAAEKLSIPEPLPAKDKESTVPTSNVSSSASLPFTGVRFVNVSYDFMTNDKVLLIAFQNALLHDLANLSGVSVDSLTVQGIQADSMTVLIQSKTSDDNAKVRTFLATPEGRQTFIKGSAVTTIPSAAFEDPSQPITVTDATDEFDASGTSLSAPAKPVPIVLPSTNNPAVASLVERHAHELNSLRDSHAEAMNQLQTKLSAKDKALRHAQSQASQAANELANLQQKLANSEHDSQSRLSPDAATKLKDQLATTEKKLKEAEDLLQKIQFDTSLQLQEATDLLASTKAVNERELSVLKHAYEIEVKEMKDALSRAISRRNSLEGGAINTAAEAAAEVAELSGRIALLQAENARTIADLEARHAAALGEAQGKYKASLAALNEATAAAEAAKTKAVAEARDEAMHRAAELTSLHQNRANELESKLAALDDKRIKELSAAESRHANEITALMDKYAKEMGDLNRKLVEKEETRFTDYKSMEERKNEELGAANNRYDSRVKAIEEQAMHKEQEIQRNAEANIERIRKDMEALKLLHTAEIQKLHASVDEEKARIQGKIEEVSSSLNKQHAVALKAELEKAKRDHETATEDARTRAEKTLSTVREDLRKQLANADTRLTELSIQIVAEQAKAHGRAETIASLRKHIGDLENERNTLRTQIEKDADKATKAIERAVTAAKEAHAHEIAKINSEHESALRALKAEHERQRAEDAIRYSEAAADGREAQLKELESKYQAQFTEINRGWEEKVSNSTGTISLLQKQLVESNQAHSSAENKLQALAATLATNANNQEKDWINRVATLETAYESKIVQLQEALLTAERMTERATMDFSAAMVEAKAIAAEEARAAARAAETMRARVDADMRDLHAAHALEIERIQATWAAKVSTAEAEASAKLVTAAAEANQRLNDLYRTTKDTAATLEKEYQQRLEEAVSRERTAKEHALRDADAQSKAAIDSVNSSYERELAELRTTHERAIAESTRKVADEIAKHSEEIIQFRHAENERSKRAQDTHEETLRSLRQKHDTEVAALRRALAEADARSAELETSVKTLTADFQTSLAKADADAASRVAAVVSTTAAESNRLSEEYSQNLATLRATFASQVAAAEEQIRKSLQDEARAALEATKKEATTKFEDHKTEAKAAYDQVSAELTKVSIELSKLQAEHGGCGPSVDQLRNNANIMLDAERQAHMTALNAVQKEANEALERAQQAAFLTSQQVKFELEAYTTARDEEINALRTAFEKAKDDFNSTLDTLRQTLTKDKEDAIHNLTVQHTEELEKLRNEAAATLATTKEDYEKLIAKIREEANVAVHRAQAEAEVAIAQAEQESERAIAKAAEDATKTVETDRTETANALAKAQEDIEVIKQTSAKELLAARTTYDELLQAAALTEARRQNEIRNYETKLENAQKEIKFMEDRANVSIRNTEERGRVNQLALEASTADIQARLNAAMADRTRLLTRERELISKIDELSRTIDTNTATTSAAVAEAFAAKATLEREARRWTNEKEGFTKTEAELREQLKERTVSAEALQERAARALAASAAQTKHITDEHEKLIKIKDEQILRLKGMIIDAQREMNRLRNSTSNGTVGVSPVQGGNSNNSSSSPSGSSTTTYGNYNSNNNNGYSLEDLATMNFDDVGGSNQPSSSTVLPVQRRGSNGGTSIGAIEASILPPSINEILGNSPSPASGSRQGGDNNPNSPSRSAVEQVEALRERMKKGLKK